MGKGAEGNSCVDVTPHNRSKCHSKTCKETLKKGEIRIGNSSKKNWWHVKCLPEKQKSKVQAITDLDGYSELSAADQKRLQKEWENAATTNSGSEEEVEPAGKKIETGKRKRKNEKEAAPKKKKKKENDGVKRGRSAYIFFCNAKRAEVAKERSEMKAKEIMAELGARWAQLTAEDKAPYIKMQLEDKQRYVAEKAQKQSEKDQDKKAAVEVEEADGDGGDEPEADDGDEEEEEQEEDDE